MAFTAKDPKFVNVVGQVTNAVVGAINGSGTSTTVTIPQLYTIDGVVCSSAASTTPVYVGDITGNTFTATHASDDNFYYIAWGKAKR